MKSITRSNAAEVDAGAHRGENRGGFANGIEKASRSSGTLGEAFGYPKSAGRAVFIQMFGSDVDVAGPDDGAVFGFCVQKERKVLELEKQGLVEQGTGVVDGLLASGKGQPDRIVWRGGRGGYDPVRCFHDDH